MKQEVQSEEAEHPTFLYVMPMSPTRVFFEETCLASRHAMPFDLLKKKLMLRLDSMGVRIIKIYEEEWSCIPVGGSLPNTEQKNLAFGTAASMVHPATAYSVVRSLSEAPKYASAIAGILKQGIYPKHLVPRAKSAENVSMQECKDAYSDRYLQFNNMCLKSMQHTIKWMWQGFLGSTLLSADLVLFALYMYVIAPHSMRMCLVRYLFSDPTGAVMPFKGGRIPVLSRGRMAAGGFAILAAIQRRPDSGPLPR
ncbi:hypothetical protein AAC387_Pa06g1383 [Persea americana]